MQGYVFQHLLMILIVILSCIFLLSRAQVFRTAILQKGSSFWGRIGYIIFFGVIGIAGTHSGFQTTYAIANTRAVAVITAGLIGGPWVGIGSGIIVGVERYFLGGISASASAVSTIMQGIIAGLFYQRFSSMHNRWLVALALGFFLESLHMIILLFFSSPFSWALQLVETISTSMLIVNPLGIAMIIAILDTIYDEREKVEGKAAQLALQIAEKTLVFLKKGLNENSAEDTVRTIYEVVGTLDAVVITSLDRVLAFIGEGADHHKGAIQTTSTLQVLNQGNYELAVSKEEIGCQETNCMLQSKIVVALLERGKIVGSLGFYKIRPDSISPFEIELIKGLSQLISTQLEASRVELYASLQADAEIKALQTQINPHFLFNALNTIVYYCRSEPEIARDLLLHLADFYRNNLTNAGEWVDLETEIQHINAYVQLESARFRNNLQIVYDFPETYHRKIPALILQPLVENAIKHGLYPKKSGGNVIVSGRRTAKGFYIISIKDDGVGIPRSKLNHLLLATPEDGEKKTSIGLFNVHQRLQAIYGADFGLKIESEAGEGTCVSLTFPDKEDEV
ncbi:MAG: LytS/YhcK type 5TM receptor domain-containing protein [Sporomusaceae bacterium]|nr:LytS/YhcK type 5TM receptor domain-containing protein [Sporomusaceae bacterium]